MREEVFRVKSVKEIKKIEYKLVFVSILFFYLKLIKLYIYKLNVIDFIYFIFLFIKGGKKRKIKRKN